MNARGRRTTWLVAAGVHLALVFCGAFGIPLVPRERLAGSILETIRDYTGSNSGYGFFAPGVAAEWRATFDVCSDAAHCTPVPEEQVGHEARLLLVTIDSIFAEEQLRDVVARSYAARVFARYPHADIVLVKAAMYSVPPMSFYRRGARPHWRNLYGYAFHRVRK